MKIDSFIKILCIVVLFCSPIVGCGKKKPETTGSGNGYMPRNIYVAVNGNNSNNGNLQTPVKTIQKGLELVKPGDTVFVREGVYRGKVSFSKSGNIGAYITLKPYAEEKAVISGEGLLVNGNEALVTMNSVSWIILEGFDICDFKTYNAWANVDGIVIKGGGSNIILKNNRVFNIENNANPEQGRSGHGIHIIGNTAVPLTKIFVENNEIFDCNTGYSENLTINGYVDGFEIKNNKVYNGENIGIVAAGGYAANSNPLLNYARNGIISDNEVYHILGSSGPIPTYQGTYGAPAIYVDGAQNIIVERNSVHDNDRGIGIMSENIGYPTANCIIRNNFVYNNYTSGIYLGGYEGQSGGGGTNNCSFVNNTLFFNNRESGYFGETEGEFRLKQGCTNNVFKNNIVYARPDKGLFVNKENTGGSGNVFDYNLYYSTGIYKWVWDTVPVSDFDTWKTITREDSHSIAATDPQLVGLILPDLHIQNTSQAKNTGVLLSISGDTDIDGQPRVFDTNIDKGADEIN